MAPEVTGPMGIGRPGRPAVKEVSCKSILHATASDYSLNPYVGCQHACVYCFARFMNRFTGHREPWGTYVDVKANAAEVLAGQLRRVERRRVFVSRVSDGWQPLEERYRLTRRCLALLVEGGFPLVVLSKSALLARDLDILAGSDVRLGVTLTTASERLRERLEPFSSSIGERLGCWSGPPPRVSAPSSCWDRCCPSFPTRRRNWSG